MAKRTPKTDRRRVGIKPEDVGTWANKSGLCLCGCGQTTNKSPQIITRKGVLLYNIGEHYRYIVGHTSRGHRVPAAERMQKFIDKTSEHGCWLWRGSLNNYGYGRLDRTYSHILAWETANGPVPDGMELDHLCRTPACCNPSHLEPVTRQENQRRGMGPTGVNARKLRCIRGHDLSGANLYSPPKRPHTRQCRKCIQIRRDEKKVAA